VIKCCKGVYNVFVNEEDAKANKPIDYEVLISWKQRKWVTFPMNNG
jgi:hypothetical protein